jgi:hypothetical protein
VTTVAVGIKGALSAARTAVGIIKWADSSEARRVQLNESIAEVQREGEQVCYAVCKALVAHSLGRDPSDDEVNDVFSAAINNPAFPNRAYRLLGEARKSASRRRRAFLASVLFGLSFSKLPDDERDRVDMAVERMMPADADLLWVLAEKDRTARPSAELEGPYFFKGTRLLALTRGLEVRIGSTDDWVTDEEQFADEVYTDARFGVDHAAFGSLLSFGLADMSESMARQSDWDWEIRRLTITPLGRLVVRAIEEVRPGFDAIADGVP